MNIVSTLKTVTRAEIAKLKGTFDTPALPPLVSAVEYARQEWRQAINEMNNIDSDLTDYAILKASAAERRYMALLKQAKNEGINAWSATEGYSPQNKICAESGA